MNSHFVGKFSLKIFWLISLIGMGWVLFGITAVTAQEEEMTLRLNRDFGSSIGGQISGTFSYRVNAPDEVVRVEFFLDDEQIGEDRERPFRLQFQTSNYAPGPHTLYAIGYTSDGTTFSSNVLSRQFQTGSDSTRSVLWVVIPLIIISLGVRFLVNWIAGRGQTPETKKVQGLLGGTICPNCGRPYAIHWWSPHFFGTRYDRCPHCGAWRMVRRAQPSELAAALEEESPDLNPQIDPDGDLRKRLDDSRFE